MDVYTFKFLDVPKHELEAEITKWVNGYEWKLVSVVPNGTALSKIPSLTVINGIEFEEIPVEMFFVTMQKRI